MFKKHINIPLLKQAEVAYKAMTPSERWLFYLLFFIVIISTFTLSYKLYTSTTIIVPKSGGSITEGLVGAPRFINPILALSQTDKDLSELIYAGLMGVNEDGELVPELAQSYTVSEDSKKYTFILRKNLVFHDGTPLTASDVIFTIQKALQPDIKSPERANWEGVTIEQDGDYKITFTLNKPYAQFLQNTTLGILPEEHWNKLSADEFIFSNLNTSPIGSGPFKFVNMAHDNSGIPSSIYLTYNKDFVLGAPYIKNFTINFYSNRDLLEDALKSKQISSIAEVSPESAQTILKDNRYNLTESTLPRIFAIFFNQSRNEALQKKDIRKALRDSIDTQDLVNKVLAGYALAINSPMIPTSNKPLQKPITIEQAQELIGDEQVSITLTTANSPELKAVANYVANIWREIGVDVKIEVFESGDITNNVLRTREYDALLFGEILGVDPDLYAFWHSSQRNDPGLNIANYANTKVDKLLLKARSTLDTSDRFKIYEQISSEIKKDIPAVFLYAPSFLYISDKRVLGINFPNIMEPHNRFDNVYKWHIKTSRSLKLNN